ncbi:hypothetical protein BCh11DRAFT_00345 [Burkholderia sp. Ch1-1]|nr:hypothetical protein BCh11DRAFT_00345 [Burkholderia sp. Ch1-1]
MHEKIYLIIFLRFFYNFNLLKNALFQSLLDIINWYARMSNQILIKIIWYSFETCLSGFKCINLLRNLFLGMPEKFHAYLMGQKKSRFYWI